MPPRLTRKWPTGRRRRDALAPGGPPEFVTPETAEQCLGEASSRSIALAFARAQSFADHAPLEDDKDIFPQDMASLLATFSSFPGVRTAAPFSLHCQPMPRHLRTPSMEVAQHCCIAWATHWPTVVPGVGPWIRRWTFKSHYAGPHRTRSQFCLPPCLGPRQCPGRFTPMLCTRCS